MKKVFTISISLYIVTDDRDRGKGSHLLLEGILSDSSSMYLFNDFDLLPIVLQEMKKGYLMILCIVF